MPAAAGGRPPGGCGWDRSDGWSLRRYSLSERWQRPLRLNWSGRGRRSSALPATSRRCLRRTTG